MYQFIKNNNGNLFVNADNKLLADLSNAINRITFGTSEANDFIGVITDCNPFVKLKCKSKNDKQTLNEKEIMEIVACKVCQVHLPKSEALIGSDGFYCSEAHRREAGR